MALKPLECPNCHGLIETFDETTKKGFCPFCDALIADIPSFQDAYEVKIAGSVVVEGIEGADQLLKRIDGFILLGDISRASSLLNEFTDKYPADFRGWHKQFELATRNGVKALPGESLLRYAKNMAVLAKTPSEKDAIRNAKSKLESFQAELNQENEKLLSEISDYERQGQSIESKRIKAQERARSSQSILDKSMEAKEAAEKDVDAKKGINTESETTLMDWAIRFAIIGFICGAIYIFWHDQGVTFILWVILLGVPFYGFIGAAIGSVVGLMVGGIVNAIRESSKSKRKQEAVAAAESQREQSLSTFDEAKARHDEDSAALNALLRQMDSNKYELSRTNDRLSENNRINFLINNVLNALS